ncbi:MAG: hypothetical protein ACFFB5_13025 [Promethearchaeota archaeon]
MIIMVTYDKSLLTGDMMILHLVDGKIAPIYQSKSQTAKIEGN